MTAHAEAGQLRSLALLAPANRPAFAITIRYRSSSFSDSREGVVGRANSKRLVDEDYPSFFVFRGKPVINAEITFH